MTGLIFLFVCIFRDYLFCALTHVLSNRLFTWRRKMIWKLKLFWKLFIRCDHRILCAGVLYYVTLRVMNRAASSWRIKKKNGEIWTIHIYHAPKCSYFHQFSHQMMRIWRLFDEFIFCWHDSKMALAPVQFTYTKWNSNTKQTLISYSHALILSNHKLSAFSIFFGFECWSPCSIKTFK